MKSDDTPVLGYAKCVVGTLFSTLGKRYPVFEFNVVLDEFTTIYDDGRRGTMKCRRFESEIPGWGGDYE